MRGEVRTIVSGVAFGESARWHDGRVWFSDWIDGDVISVDTDGSNRQVHVHLDEFPICFDWLPNRTMVVVDGARGLVLQVTDSGLSELADLSVVSSRPWNEIVAHPSGRAYVNGIGYDMMADEEATTGPIAVIDVDGSVRQVAEELAFPNGMAISADGATLVVAESHAGRLTAFTIASNGDLDDRRVFAQIAGSAPDGICFASDGTIWYADVPNQHCQRVEEGGRVFETIATDRGCFSCALSTDNTLYIAATVWDEQTFVSRGGVLLAVELAE